MVKTSGSSEETVLKSYANALFEKEHDIHIIGLTGKAGIDLGGVASLFTGDTFKRILIEPFLPEGISDSDCRDYRTIQRYLRVKWEPFIEVSMKTVILTFLLDRLEKSPDMKIDYEFTFGDTEGPNPVELRKKLEEALSNRGYIAEKSADKLRNIDEILGRYCDRGTDSHNDVEEIKGQVWKGIAAEVDSLVPVNISVERLVDAWRGVREESFTNRKFESFRAIAMCFGVLPTITQLFEEAIGSGRDGSELPALVFQRMGNDIRAYGTISVGAEREDGKHLFDLPDRASKFCRLLRHYCMAEKTLHCVDGSTEGISSQRACSDNYERDDWNPTNVVITSFKSVFETLYFRKRYPSFFLLAITGDEKEPASSGTPADGRGQIEASFVGLGENTSRYRTRYIKICKKADILSDSKEEGANDLSEGSLDDCLRKLLQKVGRHEGDIGDISAAEIKFAMYVRKYDALRDRCYRNGVSKFVLQDVVSCIEDADYFITRNLSESNPELDHGLTRQLARFLALAMHPGLLKPTPVERCMQIAMSAKLNSGCLSRQVGAVVTDDKFNILSLGWNDAPCGSVTCMRRNLIDVKRKVDESAYSNYELNDPTFRAYVEEAGGQLEKIGIREILSGLPAAFCFKDIYQDIIGTRDQIHTRALHAEERALAACGNDRAAGGFLFTTSSPCELCAKKAKEAKEAGISRIYYIERYPGISRDHIIDDGFRESRAKYEFFVGATGLAYVKLYTLTIPYKDELEALGASPVKLYERASEQLGDADAREQ